MNTIFLGFVNRAVTAGWLVLAVILLRQLLRRAPRSVHCLLWAAVAVRLLLPFSIESPASLVPTTQTIVPETIQTGHPVIQTGIPAVNSYFQDSYFEGVTVPAGTAVQVTDVLSILWLTGLAVLLLYCLGTYLHMRSHLRTAVRLRDNLWQSEWVDSPFVLGLFVPRIYLPFRLDEETLTQVEAHERAHITRGDHVWKVLAFLLLAVHWFHPLLWVAYFLFCRDLEYACDERVIRQLDGEGRKHYSDALLRCASPRRAVAPCPVAFGETGVGGRIKNVLRYQRPAFWVAVIAALALLVTAVCFLTDPPVKNGEQWLHTRRASNLGETTITFNYGTPSNTYYSRPLTHQQRKELSRLLRAVSDSQLTGAGFQLDAPLGCSLVFPNWVTLSLPPELSRPGVVLLKYQGNRYFVYSPELADYLSQLLPIGAAPVVWRCPYTDNLPDSTLTLRPDLAFDELTISYFHGLFDHGTPARCQLARDGSHSYTSGKATLLPGESTIWKPSVWDPDDPLRSDSWMLSWRNGGATSSAWQSADLDVTAIPVYDGDRLTAVDYFITVFNNDVPLQFTLEDDTLILTTPYPVVDNYHFNDFYGAVRYDIDGDGVAEYCTLGMGPTSGLFTFTMAAQADDQVKYANIFHTDWYDLSFAYRNGKLVVKGVAQGGVEHFFDITIRDRAIFLSEKGQDLATWTNLAQFN